MALLRDARRDELEHLSALCLRSKAVWGYDTAFLQACRSELTVTAHDLETTHLQVAEDNGALLGVVQVTLTGPRECDLTKLFVNPERLGRGVGRQLFAWAVATARSLGAERLVIVSDPGAAAFYRRMGAIDAGLAPSLSIAGRSLPRLSLSLR